MRVKRFALFSTIFALFFLALIHFTNYGLVEAKSKCGSLDDKDYNADELSSLIGDCENEIDQIQGREKTLASELEYLASQVSLTELRIRNSNATIDEKRKQIEKLSNDIDDLSLRIDKLKASIKYQEVVLNERLREQYKNIESSPIMVIFGSDSLNRIVQKTEYLRVMEGEDKRLMQEMSKTKDAFDMQKTLFQQSKAKEEDLKAQLESELHNLQVFIDRLESQKEEKKRLLEVTQNDEAKYQQLLSDAKKELNQIVGAVSVLKGTESKNVKKGDVIGIQGNTGNSSGEHLHFGVYKYSSFDEIDGWNWYYSNYVDPAKKLKNKSVYWNDGCKPSGNKSTGSGDWSWPLSNPTISQGYGITCWSGIYYGGKPHPAYDMYGSYSSPVYAVDDGKAYSCRNCLGDGANGVFIFHDDGYMTIYWHLK